MADGLRSLGSPVDRKAFQYLLEEMLHANNIEYVHVESSDYEERFLRCVELVQQLLAADASRLVKF
ncbi:Trifunctional NAD biosynthesis/regulator protein NadR [compost metagenome]